MAAGRLTAAGAAAQYDITGRNATVRFKAAYKKAVASGASARGAKRAGVRAANTGSGGG